MSEGKGQREQDRGTGKGAPSRLGTGTLRSGEREVPACFLLRTCCPTGLALPFINYQPLQPHSTLRTQPPCNHPVADSTYCMVNLVHGCVPPVQAVLPLRGKILNVERKDDAALLKNNEIANIIVALGLGSKVGSLKEGLGSKVGCFEKGLGSKVGCWREGLGSKVGCLREGLGSEIGCSKKGLGSKVGSSKKGLGGQVGWWREGLGSEIGCFEKGLGCNSSWFASW